MPLPRCGNELGPRDQLGYRVGVNVSVRVGLNPRWCQPGATNKTKLALTDEFVTVGAKVTHNRILQPTSLDRQSSPLYGAAILTSLNEIQTLREITYGCE